MLRYLQENYFMDVLLVGSRINGIKNLNKEISISYIKKNFDESVFNDCHIKTIYGTNGSGKTGIVHAYDSFCFLVTNTFPLKDQIFVSKFKQIINKKTKEFFIENIFTITIDDDVKRYKYSLMVSTDDAGELFFKHEKLTILNKRLEDSRVVFLIENGEFVVKPNDSRIKTDFDTLLLKQNAFSIRAIEGTKNIEGEDMTAICSTIVLALNLNISYGSYDDVHELFDYQSTMHFNFKDFKHIPSVTSLKKMGSAIRKFMGERHLCAIDTSEEEKYKKIISKLSLFLKKLNCNIVDVEPYFKHEGLISYCFLRFVYDGYDVDYEFESTGIKKLCSIFFTLYNASKGSIAIIDEVDAGIHDVFLTALVEYFVLYTDCQLILTTHHVGVMDIVKQVSKSIDILTDKGTIETWTKNGDSSPSSLYRKGYLDGVPYKEW